VSGSSGTGKICTLEYISEILKENYRIIKCSGSLSYRTLVSQFYSDVIQKPKGIAKNVMMESEILEEARKYIEMQKEKMYFLWKNNIRLCIIEEADNIEGALIFFGKIAEYSDYLKFISIFSINQ